MPRDRARHVTSCIRGASYLYGDLHNDLTDCVSPDIVGYMVSYTTN